MRRYIMGTHWTGNLVVTARVKEFIEWFNSLEDEDMAKLLDHIDQYKKNIHQR
jgi:hypothetical protein